MPLHLIKLCVGVERVEDLEAYWRGEVQRIVHTRQTPRREAELLGGGSLFWVIKGVVQCRQAIIAVETVGEGAASRCEIHVRLPVVRTLPMPRRPFQGWRYLKAEDAPSDLVGGALGAEVPPELVRQLRELGAW